MASYEASLQPKVFEEIKEGVRKYEVALNNEEHRMLVPGDEIVLKRRHGSGETLTVIIEERLMFANLQQLLSKIPLKDLGEFRSDLDFLQTFMAHNRTEELQKAGIVAFKIRVKNV